MKTVVNNSSSTVRQPFLGVTMEHLVESMVEMQDALARGLITDYTTGSVVIIYGCELTGSASGNGNPFSVSSGAIFYNGEIYLVDAVSGTISGSNVLTGAISQTFRTGDPITMSDLSLSNVHKIRKITIQQATSGSGLGNYVFFRKMREITNSVQYSDNSGVAVSSGTWTLLTTMTHTTPNDGYTRRLKISFKATAVGANDGTAQNVNFRIRNTTSGTTYDYTEYKVLLTNTHYMTGHIYLETLVSVNANSVIEIQREWVSGTTTVANMKMIIEEVR